MHEIRFFSSRFQFSTRNRKEPKPRKQVSNGTGWIRNETERNRLDPKRNRMEPVRSEMKPNSTRKTRKQNRIGFGILVSKPKKNGIELNFRFLFFVFLSFYFQSLWLWKKRGHEATKSAPSQNWVFQFANSEFKFQQSVTVRIRPSQHILAVNSWLKTHLHVYPIGSRYAV